MGGGKGRESALSKLKKAGKAWVYENKTWKFGVVLVLCGPEDMAGVMRENVNKGHPESEHLSVKGMSGLTLGSDMSASKASGRYLMWVDTSPGWKCLPAVAHEAVHVASMALFDRGVDCDVGKAGSSECVAYLVEDVVEFAVKKMCETGILLEKEDQNGNA